MLVDGGVVVAGRSRVAGCLLLVLVVAGCGSESDEQSAPSPAASPSSAAPVPVASSTQLVVEGPSPADVVDDPAARLVHVAVSPVDPRVRAAVWWTCPTEDCASRHVAVAASADGFRTRVVADRVWRSVPAVTVDERGNAVVTSFGRRLELTLMRPDGSMVDVHRAPAASPVVEGEIVAGSEYHRGRTTFWATDPLSAAAHGVRVPAGTVELEQHPSGQLRVLTRHGTYAWSDDGGASWAETTAASDGTFRQSLTTSAPDSHVLVAGGDGATLLPFGQIWRWDPSGWSFTDAPDAPRAYVGATAVLGDGRFLADVDAWSDTRRAGAGLKGTPPGLYVSDGDDWSSYSRLDLGAPFAKPAYNVPDVRHVDVTGARTTLGAIDPDGRSWWTSEDLGATWTEQPVR